MHTLIWWQILLLVLYAGYEILDELTIFSSLSSCVFAGFITGLIMGDMTRGLIIGATMQLTVLGVGTFGGAPKIEATCATLLATVFACLLNLPPTLAVGLFALPLAIILSPFDMLARFANVYMAQRVDKAIQTLSIKRINRDFLLGALPWALSRMIPVLVLLLLGPLFVEPLVTFLTGSAAWLIKGLEVAGCVMPAVGLAILLRFMPTKRYLPYLFLGFGITAVLTVFVKTSSITTLGTSLIANGVYSKVLSLPLLAITVIGFGIAMLAYRQATKEESLPGSSPVSTAGSAGGVSGSSAAAYSAGSATVPPATSFPPISSPSVPNSSKEAKTKKGFSEEEQSPATSTATVENTASAVIKEEIWDDEL